MATVWECAECGQRQVGGPVAKSCTACKAFPLAMRDLAAVSLPGLETVHRERVAAYAQATGEQLTAKMRTPKGNISESAGRIERDSPLFFGTGENPGLF
jgi:hypothetical protein